MAYWIELKNGRIYFGMRKGSIETIRPDNSWQTIELADRPDLVSVIVREGYSTYHSPRPKLVGHKARTPRGVEVIADAGVMGAGADGEHVTITTEGGASWSYREWELQH